MGDVLTLTFELTNSVCHKAVTKVGLDFPIWQYTTKIENAHWNRPLNSTLFNTTASVALTVLKYM
jgi:hypothetical protein